MISGCTESADIAFLLDSSSSIREPSFEKMLSFLTGIVQHTNVDTGHVRISVATFSQRVFVHFRLNRYTSRDMLVEAISKIPYRYGTTNTADGLKEVRTKVFTAKNGDRKGVPNILMLITDGQSNVNERKTTNEARRVRRAKIHVTAIGVGMDARPLRKIVSPPFRENMRVVTNFDQLASIRRNISADICQSKFMYVYMLHSIVGTSHYREYMKFSVITWND